MPVNQLKAERVAMCMTFKLPPAADGTIVVGRSMEFPMGMPTKLAVLPSRHAGTATLGSGHHNPHTWTATNGIVGMAVFGNEAWLVDGVNTEGVSAHVLFMGAGYCVYRDPKGDGSDISELDLVAFLLGTCATVEEIKVAAASVNVIGLDPGMGFVPPTHFLFHDKTGSIAIEFHPDGTVISDNPVSVATNAPYLDWHLINLGNYMGASPQNPPAKTIGALTIEPSGQGEALRSLPSDYSPASRFVRLFNFIQLADRAADATGAEQVALHILNAFDIPTGLITETMGGRVVPEVTVWDAVVNLSDLRYAYRPISNPATYVVDLHTVDFSAPARSIDLEWNGAFTPISI